MVKLEEKVYCRNCKNSTNHEVLNSYIDKSIPDDEFQWLDAYHIVRCLGCDTISFVREYGDEDQWEYNNYGERGWFNTYTVYPEKPSEDIKIIIPIEEKKFSNLSNNKNLSLLYQQVIQAYNTLSFLLCAVGLRTLVEAICKNENVTGGMTADKGGKMVRKTNLQGKINGLVEKGLITQSQSEVLHQIRELGNYAVHEIVQPSKGTLIKGIEVIEHILKQIYEFGEYKISPKNK